MSSNRGMPVHQAPKDFKKEEASEPSAPTAEKLQSSPTEASIVKVPIRQSGIRVVAIYPGFYEHIRRDVGSEFNVPSMDKVGDWMKCVDEAAEAEHKALMKLKKEKKRKPAGM